MMREVDGRLVQHVEDLSGKKRENLQAAIPLLERSRKLVTLETNVPIEEHWAAAGTYEPEGPQPQDQQETNEPWASTESSEPAAEEPVEGVAVGHGRHRGAG